MSGRCGRTHNTDANLQNFAKVPTLSSGHHSAAVAATVAESAVSGASLASHLRTLPLPTPPAPAQQEERLRDEFAKAGKQVVIWKIPQACAAHTSCQH